MDFTLSDRHRIERSGGFDGRDVERQSGWRGCLGEGGRRSKNGSRQDAHDDWHASSLPRKRAAGNQGSYAGAGKFSDDLASAACNTPVASNSLSPRDMESSVTSMCRARSNIFFSRKLNGFWA